MDTNILIRIIIFIIVIPLISLIVKNYTQKKRNKESIFVNKNQKLVKTQDSQEEKYNDSKIVPVSEFIDSYNHPEYFTSASGFLAIFFGWVFLGIAFPYFLLFLIFDLPIIAIFAGVILNIFFILALWYSINLNKNKVVINLYTDKICFSKNSQIIFEIPINKILNLKILVEEGSTIYPNEYIFINVDSEYLNSVVEPILRNEKSIEYSSLIKIKILEEQVNPLTGVNKTRFKEQLFRVIKGDR